MVYWLCLATLLQLATAQVGATASPVGHVTACFFPTDGTLQVKPSAATKMEKLLFQSEDIGQMHAEWQRFWMNDQPSHMSYQRVNGGIGP
jgi:hypothetical protein